MEFPMRLSSFAHLFVAVSCAVACCSGCFIRNCPMGGKRSMDTLPDVTPRRECIACGPEALGQCVGPSICCGPSIGCYINTDESASCARENQLPTPCQVEGEPCGSNPDGRCVANGICCTDEKCDLDAQCEVGSKTAYRKGGVSTDLLKYIRRLVDHRQYNSKR